MIAPARGLAEVEKQEIQVQRLCLGRSLILIGGEVFVGCTLLRVTL